MTQPARLEVGRVARPHGLRGQLMVELLTNRDERVAPGAVLFTADGRRLEVSAASRAGSASERLRFIVGFAGVDDRAAADALHGVALFAEPIDDPDALWVHELVGSDVTDLSGTVLGTVVAVQANPASDLLVLDGGALIPLRFVTATAPGQVVVDPPAGLLDL